jgi:hypothetical protein
MIMIDIIFVGSIVIMPMNNARRIPTTNGSLRPSRKNRFVWEFCGNKPCFSLLSRDPRSQSSASGISMRRISPKGGPNPILET